MPTKTYYIYAYIREDGTPYYIGKGKVFSEETRQKMSLAAKIRRAA